MTDYSKPDHFALKAQKEGYPARSVYKLKEMDEKFGLLKGNLSVFKALDLGAAPGSWSLYILRRQQSWRNLAGRANGGSAQAPNAGPALVSVDLEPLSREYDKGLFEKPEFLFIQGDFTKSPIREEILSHGPYNLLVSDAAPFTTGNRSIDTLRSLVLAETALNYAESALAKGGNFVVKVFQGGDTGNLLKQINGLFKSGKSFKPQACRSESFETYYLGLKKREE